MEINLSPESRDDHSRETDIDRSMTRANYFRRDDRNEVSHEALDSYATWMIADALKIKDQATKSNLLDLVQDAVRAGRMSENAEIGFSELFKVEIESIEHGHLLPIEDQKQVS